LHFGDPLLGLGVREVGEEERPRGGAVQAAGALAVGMWS